MAPRFRCPFSLGTCRSKCQYLAYVSVILAFGITFPFLVILFYCDYIRGEDGLKLDKVGPLIKEIEGFGDFRTCNETIHYL
jgi:hypothetical protein